LRGLRDFSEFQLIVSGYAGVRKGAGWFGIWLIEIKEI